MDLLATVKTALPVLASVLGGPLAGLGVKWVADKLSLPASDTDTIVAVLNGLPPEKIMELKIQEQDLKNKADAAMQAFDLGVISQVNATMQLETKAEHWPSYSWRPAIGFAVALNLVSASVLIIFAYSLVMFKAEKAAEALTALPGVLTALAALTATALPILGIASWFRGKAQADPNNDAPVKG